VTSDQRTTTDTVSDDPHYVVVSQALSKLAEARFLMEDAERRIRHVWPDIYRRHNGQQANKSNATDEPKDRSNGNT
jgi:hypothetical protein